MVQGKDENRVKGPQQGAPCVPQLLGAPPLRSAPSSSSPRQHLPLCPRRLLAFAFLPLRPLCAADVLRVSQSIATCPYFVKAGPCGQTAVVGSSWWDQSLCKGQQCNTRPGIFPGAHSQEGRTKMAGRASIPLALALWVCLLPMGDVSPPHVRSNGHGLLSLMSNI